jgi:hypothetical protein
VDGLTLFGLFAVTAMLVTYALENRSHWLILAFAAACARFNLWLAPRTMALRTGRGHLGDRRHASLVSEKGKKRHSRSARQLTIATGCDGHSLKRRIGVEGGEGLRDFCVTQWCFVVLSGAKCNGRRAAND